MRKFKTWICCLVFLAFAALPAMAQQIPEPGLPGALVRELNLSPEQKRAMKLLIWEYRQGEIRRKARLRKMLMANLDFQQRIRLRRWIRAHQYQ